MKKIITSMLLLLFGVLLASCEKPILENEPKAKASEMNIVFNVSAIEIVPFPALSPQSRSMVSIDRVCSRISLTLFKGEEKVKSVNQTRRDAHFGRLTVTVPKGTYKVVIIAHNGAGTATISSPSKIKFTNNKVTDTFYYCGDVTVEEAGQQTLTLERAVAMFQLNISDAMPEKIARLVFRYTGGSSTFDAVSGQGCIKSKEMETREVSAEQYGKPSSFQIYTFPRADSQELRIQVSAESKMGEEVIKREFLEVPIQKGQIARYTGNFFDGYVDAQSRELGLQVDTAWRRIERFY